MNKQEDEKETKKVQQVAGVKRFPHVVIRSSADLIVEEQEVLGTGKNTEVVLASLRLKQEATTAESEVQVAVKAVNTSRMTQQQKFRLDLEAQVLESLDHPFVVHLFGWFEEEHEKQSYHCQVLELLPYGSLLDQLKARNSIPEESLKQYAVELVLGLDYVHHRGVIHRDINPKNILLDAGGHIRIADFGLCRSTTTQEPSPVCGTPQYISPEALRGRVTIATDWWCMGVLLFELACGEPPFQSDSPEELFKLVLTRPVQFTTTLSSNLRDLISCLLDKNDQTRPGVDAIKRHKWFKDIDWDIPCVTRLQQPGVPFDRKAGVVHDLAAPSLSAAEQALFADF